MTYTRFRTDGLPPAQRFASWHDMTQRALVATTVRSEHQSDFTAAMELLDCGDLRVAALAQPALHFCRTHRQIRHSDPQAMQLALILSGELRIDVAGRQMDAGPGTFVVYDTSRPVQGSIRVDAGPCRQIVVHVPRTLLPLNAAMLDRLIATPICARRGIGSLLACYLRELMAQAEVYQPADNRRLSTATLDLVTTLCTSHLGANAAITGDVYQSVSWARIEDFIEQRLHDTTISPGTIAAAHQISTRYLHKLFSARGATVMGWLRQRRLERCRRELIDLRDLTRPINDIAVRAGFTDPAQFSRAFRKAYGLSPRDYRHNFVHAIQAMTPSSPHSAPRTAAWPAGSDRGPARDRAPSSRTTGLP